MKTIQAFQTSDGQVFQCEHAAKEHEDKLRFMAYTREFFESEFWTSKNKTYESQAKKFIVQWEMWKSQKLAKVDHGSNS